MRALRILGLAVFLGVVLLSFAGQAAVLHFPDGTSITGEWTTFLNEQFSIVTAYGTMQIPATDVDLVAVDPDFVVPPGQWEPGLFLTDGSFIPGSIGFYRSGWYLRFDHASGPMRFDIAQIAGVLLQEQDQYVSVNLGGYQHAEGELAVILQWQGAFDLDLEIWSDDLDYLGSVAWLGESPDITSGGEDGEWFVFQDTVHGDFGSGRYVVSPYYFGPASNQSVEAVLSIVLPDGEVLEVRQDLLYDPPYDQWFAVLIDVDLASVEVLDFFLEEEGWIDVQETPVYYEHSAGDFAVVLRWDGPVDLDLQLFSEDLEYLTSAAWTGDSPDIYDGADGEEWFVFQEYDYEDFGSGRYVVGPYFWGPATDEQVTAMLTVHFPDGQTMEVRQELQHQAPFDQWFAILVDADQHTVEVLDFFFEAADASSNNPPSFYQHTAGELAVVLRWAEPVDLDLEVWSEELEYETSAAWIGHSQDIFDGSEGEEFIVISRITEDEAPAERYVAAARFFGPCYDDGVVATITVYFPEGETLVLEQELQCQAPGDRWFAFLIDLVSGELEILDFFQE